MPKPPDPFDPVEDPDSELLRQIANDVAAAAERIERWRKENPEQARIKDVRDSLEIARELQIAAEQRALENCNPNPRRYKG